MEEQSLIVQEYCKNPVRNKRLEFFTVSRYEGNSLCGDDITVYLMIQDEYIMEYGYDGNCSMITSAAASIWGELFVGARVTDVLLWDYQKIQDEGFEVSVRRRRSAIIALLAVKNALMLYEGQETLLGFDDLLGAFS